MRAKKRPPTLWIAHCVRKVRSKGKRALSEDSARRICAGNWWHRAGPGAKRKAVAKHEAPRSVRRRLHREGRAR